MFMDIHLVSTRGLECCAAVLHQSAILQADDSQQPATLSAVVTCASVNAYMRGPELRGCFPPPPAPPVITTVAAVVLTGVHWKAAIVFE